MKKAKTVVLILLLFVMLAACYTGSLWFVRTGITPSGYFYMNEKLDEKSGDTDSYDNIGFREGKLYYNFQAKSEQLQKSGIYEISESGARYITDEYNSIDDYFKGIKPKPMDDEYYEEELDDDDNDFDIDNEIKDLYRKKDTDEKYDDDEDEYYWTLYTETDDDTVIYLSKDMYIKEVDLKTHKCLFKQKLKDNIIDFDIIDSDGLWDYELREYDGKIIIVRDQNSQYVIYNVNDNFSEVFCKHRKNNEYFNYEYYKGKLFIGSDEGGIYRLNLKTNKVQKLCGNKAVYLYIFGDKWVYFNDRDDNLYRTAQDGSKTETLFDKGW
ncbi:MAG: hypothetical protein IJT79_06055 [Ruminococcus sp.]|nr:hypothetical protein [Ruminococcus sp.]